MTTHELHSEEIALLRQELEMLMAERQAILKVTGAAAAFVAELDTASLPEETYDAAELLAESLNALSEETLREALEAIHAHLDMGSETGQSAGAPGNA